MDYDVIYPLSENTGRQILSALLRIAAALERMSDTVPGDSAGVDDDMLVLTGQGITVTDDMLSAGDATVNDDMLTF